MDLIAKFQFFKDLGVKKMFSMRNSKSLNTQTDNIVFITRPGLDQMDKISDAVKSKEMSSSGTGNRIDFHVLFVPNKSLLCEMRLKGTIIQISWSLFTYTCEKSFPNFNNVNYVSNNYSQHISNCCFPQII